MVNHTKKRQHVGLAAAAAVLAILASAAVVLPSAAADTGCQSWQDDRGLQREHCEVDACLEDATGYRLGHRADVQIGVMPRLSSQRC